MSTFEQIRQWVQSPTTQSPATPDQAQADQVGQTEQTEQARKELYQLLDQLMGLPYDSDPVLASESTQESTQAPKQVNASELAKLKEDICG